MRAQLIMAVMMVALYGGLFDRAVHPLNLAVGPWMVGFRQTMLDPVGLTDHVEAHWPRINGVPVAGLLGELNAIIGENGMDLTGHGFEHIPEQLPSGAPVSLIDELRHGELAGAINADKEIELAFNGLHFGDVDMKEPDRVALELLPLWFVPFDIGQARYAVPPEAPVQRRPRQMWDRRLQRIEAVVQRQQCMASERYDCRFLRLGQNR